MKKGMMQPFVHFSVVFCLFTGLNNPQLFLSAKFQGVRCRGLQFFVFNFFSILLEVLPT